MNTMNLKMTLRFYVEDNKVFGPGVAQLLHRVQELHSLRAAALSMNMAYSKAWTMLRSAEKELGFKLLHSSTGGKGGGGQQGQQHGQREKGAQQTEFSCFHVIDLAF